MSPTVFDRFCLRLGRASALVAVILAPVCLAEAAARLLHDPPPVRRVYDPFAYRIPQPLLVDRFTSDEGVRVTVRLNELGMRGPSTAEPPAPGALTLVFLGGSTTENYAFPLAETFPEQVGERVGEHLGRPVRVLNAGMAAATTSVSLSRLQHQVLDLRPSLVVVMHGINDLLSGLHPAFRRDGRHLPQPPAAGRRPRSYLLSWLRQRRSRLVIRPAPPASGGQPLDDWQGFAARQVFERNLLSMAAVAEAHGVPILFLSQPTMYREEPLTGDEERLSMAGRLLEGIGVRPDVPSLARGMRAFNAVTMALSPTSLVRTFDLVSRVPRSFDLFLDDCHLTRAGNRRLAVELSPVIEQILRRAAPSGAEPPPAVGSAPSAESG